MHRTGCVILRLHDCKNALLAYALLATACAFLQRCPGAEGRAATFTPRLVCCCSQGSQPWALASGMLPTPKASSTTPAAPRIAGDGVMRPVLRPPPPAPGAGLGVDWKRRQGKRGGLGGGRAPRTPRPARSPYAARGSQPGTIGTRITAVSRRKRGRYTPSTCAAAALRRAGAGVITLTLTLNQSGALRASALVQPLRTPWRAALAVRAERAYGRVQSTGGPAVRVRRVLGDTRRRPGGGRRTCSR